MAEKGAAAPPPVAVDVEELPTSIVRRVVKEKLGQLRGNDGEEGADVALHKEALLSFSESARLFIHYLSATANDICKESKRQTINAEDVFRALEEIEFPEFVDPLRVSLDDYRKKNAEKKAATGAKSKKRKTEEQLLSDGKAETREVEGGEDRPGDAYDHDGKDE